jgi:hypothetical protein
MNIKLTKKRSFFKAQSEDGFELIFINRNSAFKWICKNCKVDTAEARVLISIAESGDDINLTYILKQQAS